MSRRLRGSIGVLAVAGGTALGGASAVQADTNNCPAPIVRTLAASRVTGYSAQLNGTINPNDSAVNGCATSYDFQYGTTTGYSSHTAVRTLSPGTSTRDVSATVSKLTPGRTYHYRIVAVNSNSVSTVVALGRDASFRARIPASVSLKVSPTTRRHTPYAFLATGRVSYRGSLSKRAACSGTVHLTITQSGRSRPFASGNASLRRDCTFVKTLTLPDRTRAGAYSVGAHFNSNSYLTGDSARHVAIRVG